jgi:iron complex transport system substrate-binding protein
LKGFFISRWGIVKLELDSKFSIGLSAAAAICLLLLMTPAFVSARTLGDQAGRRVTVPGDPRRVVALAPSITEIVFELGQAWRLAGVTQYSNYPPQASALPKVGSYVQLSLEKIVALKPDLCIAIKDGNPKTVVDRLQGMQIPVYVVDPHNLQTVMRTMRALGELLNASAKAQELVTAMEARLQRIKSRLAGNRNRPRVFVQIGISPIISAGTETFIHDLILTAGGINLAAGSAAYPRFSREQVLALAPDVIVITSMARQAEFERVKRDWRNFTQIPAVRAQRIHLVDSDIFDRPSPRLIDALEVLAQLIHPELFPETGTESDQK